MAGVADIASESQGGDVLNANIASLIVAVNANTTARTAPSAAQKISTSLTPFDEDYLGQRGHMKLTQNQFLKATTCHEG